MGHLPFVMGMFLRVEIKSTSTVRYKIIETERRRSIGILARKS